MNKMHVYDYCFLMRCYQAHLYSSLLLISLFPCLLALVFPCSDMKSDRLYPRFVILPPSSLELLLHTCVLKHALHFGRDVCMYYNKNSDFMHLHPAPLFPHVTV